MDTSDQALIEACRRGDQAAWEALVAKYQRLVFAVPRRAGLDADAAADVFQSVFAQLVQSLDRLEQPDRIGAWLVTTAKRLTWRNVARARAGGVASADPEAELAEVADASPLQDEALARLELQATIRGAVSSLDERCKELITLLFLTPEPPEYAEIAARLGMPEGSIGPTRARCLKKLGAIVGGGDR